ncbi:hypothetical protein LOK49_LG15G02312 [Camellia lanceoleosa]|uniref:Uncharacterized protein n=1 Tax=Camellia lanceoleosa TaxID=1840588 RepID=A0ACC0F802_9ERIC|nr:hypothetical protein LOK49_LG15G02312 [Camellia lanceoleosa]
MLKPQKEILLTTFEFCEQCPLCFTVHLSESSFAALSSLRSVHEPKLLSGYCLNFSILAHFLSSISV